MINGQKNNGGVPGSNANQIRGDHNRPKNDNLPHFGDDNVIGNNNDDS